MVPPRVQQTLVNATEACQEAWESAAHYASPFCTHATTLLINRYADLCASVRIYSSSTSYCTTQTRSKKQVVNLVAPHPDALVSYWLVHREIPSLISTTKSTTHGGDWLTIYKLPPTSLAQHTTLQPHGDSQGHHLYGRLLTTRCLARSRADCLTDDTNVEIDAQHF